MTENKMFCFQCQETAKGTGCTIKGVCGKEATTSKWQDLLLSVVRGIGTIQHSIDEEPTPEVTRFLTDALFTTITNANFNDQDILQKVDKGIVLKKQLLEKAASMNIHLPAYQEVTWGGEKTDYEAEGARESVLRHENPDIRSQGTHHARSEGYGSILRARSPSGRREQRDYKLYLPCSRHHQQP